MPFQLKNPSASRYDLKPEQFQFFSQALDLVRGYGKAHIMREAVIVQTILQYGGEKALLFIERWCARGMTSLDRLQSLCDGQEPLEFEKPVANEMPGKGRRAGSDPKSLKEIMPKTPEEFLNGKAPAIPKPKKRLPDGYFTEELALEWMKQYHPDDLDLWKEYYFTSMGHDPQIGEIFKLRNFTS